MAMVEVHQLNRTYNIIENKQLTSQPLYHNLSLKVEEGEFVAIVGDSGCGKSTLLHIMGMLDSIGSRRYKKVSGSESSANELKPEIEGNGQILIDGQDITQLTGNAQADFINQNIGFIFQLHHLIPELNAQQNVALPMRIQGKSKAQANDRAEQLLEDVGLLTAEMSNQNRRAVLSKRPAVLSGGERQRVAIARALINQPKVLLADEPTGSLQPSLKDGIIDLFVNLNRHKNITILMVTHDRKSLCDKTKKLKVHKVFEFKRDLTIDDNPHLCDNPELS
ncbi:MAG: ABC transporter ATP-binding protein [Candidatus Parabeggiatoa sp.]|nr:ABC transporter ATP-binding protein [Candidatus Parabeggiatoa sp.]